MGKIDYVMCVGLECICMCLLLYVDLCLPRVLARSYLVLTHSVCTAQRLSLDMHRPIHIVKLTAVRPSRIKYIITIEGYYLVFVLAFIYKFTAHITLHTGNTHIWLVILSRHVTMSAVTCVQMVSVKFRSNRILPRVRNWRSVRLLLAPAMADLLRPLYGESSSFGSLLCTTDFVTSICCSETDK